MSYDAENRSRTPLVQFVPDEDVLEHITDKSEGIQLRKSTSAQRINNVKSLTKNRNEHHADDDTLEVWKEKDYVDVLGTDAGDILQDAPGTGGGDVYSFQTVKRSNRMAQLAVELARTPGKTVTFSTRDGLEEAVSPPASNKKQSTNKTPSKGKKPEFVSTTPHRLRKRLSAADLRSDSESDYSDEDMDDGPATAKTPSKASQIQSEASQTPGKTPSKRGSKKSNLVEEYFEAHSSSKVLTSDRTLQKLHTPKLDQETLQKLLDQSPSSFADDIRNLTEEHEGLFYKWMLQLHLGFNIILYGLGSKRNLIEKFRTTVLQDSLHVVINGFFPSITIKSILNVITEEALDYPGKFRSPLDQMNFIVQRFKEDPALKLYLLIHNLDSAMLRGEKSQQILGQLASISNIQLLASIDHINAPLLWDQSKQSIYNWLWYEATTYSSYIEETSYENSLLVKRSGALALSSLTHVLRSLTPNARTLVSRLLPTVS
ncbi:hypothetical protein GDO78_016490 [Eleutherodactylus coqui]|uniref:Origin recognition complex subunit 2 n=1 Tax=Eleutherodactylus coqui TaxID=57060 RepID=A0A8J6JZI7_ELECQ|nr:hypothetical protein GDO78_016490 [Eleutherodactylus coqui]